jgi:hypothetical protein|nr:MAG TPA: hypothetical protein [Caudoviricetes sp.]
MISVLKTLLEIKKMLATVETKKLLWSNARPNSEFSSQSLSIDGNYDEYIIEWNDYVGENARSSLSLKKGESVKYCASSIGGGGTNFWVNARTVASSGSGSSHRITFGAGTYKSQGNTSAATSNASVIPARIYGVKKLGN